MIVVFNDDGDGIWKKRGINCPSRFLVIIMRWEVCDEAEEPEGVVTVITVIEILYAKSSSRDSVVR